MLSVTSTLLSILLPFTTVLAIPSSRYGARVARRLEGSRPLLSNCLERSNGAVSNATIYSTNWAGALWNKDNGTFTSVTGTFTVPIPSGGDGTAASVWVGIDGNTCKNAILQTGIDLTLSNGHTSYDAWYEWYPAPSYDFTGINISGGDIVKLTVTASSTTSGTATIENLTSGQVVSKGLTSTAALCGQNAEWIVEDFEQSGGLAPFANFSTVIFTNAEATGNATYTPYGATAVNIDQNDQILTSVSTSGSSVTIQYV